MAMGGSQESYLDPWQEYKAISAKLKKRFLRRPNVAEATREFGVLAARLKDEECLHYAGLCHLAMARCEHTSGNVGGETGGLREAARLFMDAEKERRELGLPGFKQNLTSAIHCYGHAIKTHVEQKQVALAASLSLELGIRLHRLDRQFEAIEHLERASRYFDQDPRSKMFSLEWLALCQAEEGQFTEALATVDNLWTIAGKLGGSVCTNCEIASVLLLLELRALPSQMNERQSHLMHIYSWIPDPGGSDPLPPSSSELKNEEEFLLLQSLVQAVQWGEAGDADTCLDRLMPSLGTPILIALAIDLVDKLYKGEYRTD